MNNIFNREILNNVPEIKSWLAMYSRNSEDTKTRIEKEICVFFNTMGFKTITDIENLKAEDISKIYKMSSMQGWSNTTTNSYITTAKLFYKWANLNNIIKTNNTIFNIKRLKDDSEPKYCPTREEMQSIMATIKKHTKTKRLYTMVKLCIFTGLRRKEICNLKISDIMEGQIRIVGKGSKVRFQVVSQDMLNEVWNYINTERKENIDKYVAMGGKDLGYVFVSGINDTNGYKKRKKNLTNGNKICENSFYLQIKHMCDKAPTENNSKISTHTLRHFFGTSIYEKTLDLALTQEAMRHSDMATTRRYVHLNKEKMHEALTNISI